MNNCGHCSKVEMQLGKNCNCNWEVSGGGYDVDFFFFFSFFPRWRDFLLFFCKRCRGGYDVDFFFFFLQGVQEQIRWSFFFSFSLFCKGQIWGRFHFSISSSSQGTDMTSFSFHSRSVSSLEGKNITKTGLEIADIKYHWDKYNVKLSNYECTTKDKLYQFPCTKNRETENRDLLKVKSVKW